MAYEVIKQRGKRAYRYSVEYYHDESGKGRTRWRYQGPVDGGGEPAARPAPARDRSSTSSRLLDALERLLVRGEYAEVTASAIALEANVAHGTFYRHFKDKRDALRAAMQRLAERAEHLANLGTPTADRTRERIRVADWLRQKLMTVGEHPGVWRAWSALSESDTTIAEIRRTLRAESRAMIATYLEGLRALELTNLSDGAAAARTIMALMFGVLQDMFASGARSPAGEMIDYACMMLDRLIFSTDLGPLPQRS